MTDAAHVNIAPMEHNDLDIDVKLTADNAPTKDTGRAEGTGCAKDNLTTDNNLTPTSESVITTTGKWLHLALQHYIQMEL